MDVNRTLGLMASAALWAVALTLMVVATVVDRAFVLVGWSLISVAGAVCVTLWQLLERSRGKLLDYLAHQDLRMAAAVSASLRQTDGEQRGPTPIR